jgi:hypothetical protein
MCSLSLSLPLLTVVELGGGRPTDEAQHKYDTLQCAYSGSNSSNREDEQGEER